MKKVILALLLLISKTGISQQSLSDSGTKSVLLQQLKESFDSQEWFVPLGQAIRDLTPQQAMWKPDDSSHSIVQLVTHLLFWNTNALRIFLGKPDPQENTNNDKTFSDLRADEWLSIVKRSDSLSVAWENAVSGHRSPLTAAEARLVARVSTHNAYHIGQIMYARKQEKAWNRSKGVQ